METVRLTAQSTATLSQRRYARRAVRVIANVRPNTVSLHRLLFVATVVGVFSIHSGDARSDKLLVNVGWTLLLKVTCDIWVPGFQERSAESYAKWRQRNLDAIQRLERHDPHSLANKVNKLTPQERGKLETEAERFTPRERREVEEQCDDLIELFSRIAPDPRLSTPENTWATFLDALKNADRRLAVSCLTSIARKNFRYAILETLSDEKLKELANSFKEFRVTMHLGNIREAVVVRHDDRAGIIYFHRVDDEWKISEM